MFQDIQAIIVALSQASIAALLQVIQSFAIACQTSV